MTIDLEPKHAIIAAVWLLYFAGLALYGFARLFDEGDATPGGCFLILALIAITVTACAVLMM